ncbi:MAG: trehalose-phosphatase [Streptosporangiales bacterium]
MAGPQGFEAESSFPACSKAGREGLSTIRAAPEHALVALDFDGTLAPIVSDPTQARPVEGTLETLARLAATVGTVAVLTGRPARTAVEYTGLAELTGAAGLLVLGHYGLDRWEAATGSYHAAPAPAGLAAAHAELPGVLDAADLPPGVTVEDKGVSVAVHTRRSADPAAAMTALQGPLAALAERHDLTVQPGRMVVELRGHGSDKGAALAALVAEREARSVLFAGDDLGDVPAFDTVERLRAAGTPGVTVASAGPEPVPALSDRADLVLDGPSAVVAYLRTLVSA